MPTVERGILIAIEGIDGSGKSTLARNLTELLNQQNLATILTKEPGGTALGKQLRTMLQEKPIPMTPKAEFFLFASDRAQHMEEYIQPQLAQKKIIISDRMGDSALVYQGYGRGLDRTMINTINRWAMNTVQPDLTIYVKVDFATAFDRMARRNETPSSFEQEKKEFFNRLINGFDELYATHENVLIIDGQQPSEIVTQHAYEQLMKWMKQCRIVR
jgi:dTMP kinase